MSDVAAIAALIFLLGGVAGLAWGMWFANRRIGDLKAEIDELKADFDEVRTAARPDESWRHNVL